MTKYTLGFYRIDEPFDSAVIPDVLRALDGLDLRYFPMTLASNSEVALEFRTPSDYRRDSVPQEYFIDGKTLAVSMAAENGVRVSFTESDVPRLLPGSLLLQLSKADLASNEWGLRDLVRTFEAVIAAFRPDYAYGFDDAHARRRDYKERMLRIDRLAVPVGLFWLNYYGSRWVHNVGLDRLREFCRTAAFCEWMEDGGLLVAIQDAPYEEEDPGQREQQLRMEARLGLKEVQARFPNPGV